MTNSISEYNLSAKYMVDSIYSNKENKVKNMPIETKLGLTAQYLRNHGKLPYDTFEKYVGCSIFNTYPKGTRHCNEAIKYQESILNDNTTMNLYQGTGELYWSYNIIDGKLLKETYEKLFNSPLLENKDFYVSSFRYVDYSEEKNSYISYVKAYTGVVEDSGYAKINLNKARTYQDHIELDLVYSYCVYYDELNSKCYESADMKKGIGYNKQSFDENAMIYNSNIKGILYRATFVKNGDGSYTWYNIIPMGEYKDGM